MESTCIQASCPTLYGIDPVKVPGILLGQKKPKKDTLRLASYVDIMLNKIWILHQLQGPFF